MGETKVATVEGQGEIVIKQMKAGRGAEIIEQQVLHVKSGTCSNTTIQQYEMAIYNNVVETVRLIMN